MNGIIIYKRYLTFLGTTTILFILFNSQSFGKIVNIDKNLDLLFRIWSRAGAYNQVKLHQSFCNSASYLPFFVSQLFYLTLIRMTKDEKDLAVFKGLML